MSFFRYLQAAFSARPWGMFVPPNWVGLVAFGLLGLEYPGFWVLGAGLELGYLLMLTTSPRYQNIIDAKDASSTKQSTQQQLNSLLVRLDASDQKRYRALEERCKKVLERQHEIPSLDLQTQADGLGKLLFVYLRLLITRAAILRVLEGSSTQSIDLRI